MIEAALLTAVLDDYDDDLPRLALADFWEEHGQPERAEFVRVQVALAAWKGVDGEHCPECGQHWKWRVGAGESEWSDCKNDHRWNSNDYRTLRRREGELLNAVPAGATSANKFFWLDNATFEATIMGGASPEAVSSGLVWRRGFVHSITCTAADWLEHGDAILAAQPVEEVTLTTWPTYERDDDSGGRRYAPWGVSGLRSRWSRVRHWHLPPPDIRRMVREATDRIGRDTEGVDVFSYEPIQPHRGPGPRPRRYGL